MAFQMRVPEFPLNDSPKAIRQIRSWLYQLNENLRYMFSHLDEDNFTETFIGALGLGQKTTPAEQLSAVRAYAEGSGWSALTLSNCVSAGGGNDPRARMCGCTVYLAGAICLSASLASGSEKQIATLPDGLAPSADMTLPAATSSSFLCLTVQTDGKVMIKNTTTSAVSTSRVISLCASYCR